MIMFEGYRQRAKTGKDIVLTTYIKPVREIFFHLPFLIFFVLILNETSKLEENVHGFVHVEF